MEISKAYIDINVILDLFLKRESRWEDVSELFHYSKRGKISLHTSPIFFDTIYYILKRSGHSDSVSRKKLRILLNYVDPTEVNKTVIEEALDAKYKDFEDVIHIRCAENSGMDLIVTSNVKDFKQASIACYSPQTLLKLIKENKSD